MKKALPLIAKTIRSKNAGVDKITFDVIFSDDRAYKRVCASGVLGKKRIAELFRIGEERITDHVYFDPAKAVKFTLRRLAPSGSLGETDLFGCQHYAPLLEIEVPWDDEEEEADPPPKQ
jgi:hypothetical protein